MRTTMAWAVLAFIVIPVMEKVGHGALLFDDFSTGVLDPAKWRVDIPTANFNPEGIASNAAVSVVSQQANLSGRAYLITQQQFSSPIIVSGDVTFVQIVGGQWEGSGWTIRDGEFLTVATRTRARRSSTTVQSFGEMEWSLQCTIKLPAPDSGWNPYMVIDRYGNTGSAGWTNLASADLSSLGIVQGDSAHFTVTDDGSNVTFTVAKIVDGTPSDTLRTSIAATSSFSTGWNYVAFYDREAPYAGQPRTIALDNLTIALAPEPSVLSLVAMSSLLLLRRRNQRAPAGL